MGLFVHSDLLKWKAVLAAFIGVCVFGLFLAHTVLASIPDGICEITCPDDPLRGWPIAKISADGSSKNWSFSPDGLITNFTDPRGISMGRQHNAAGEVTEVGYSDGTPGITNSYDRIGRVTGIDGSRVRPKAPIKIGRE